jgi:uncharacterized Zn finger protein
MFDRRWEPYVPVAQRRLRAQREMEKRRKKGHAVAPVVISGRKIANTFWGQSWCTNLERYSDVANRLPRGRTYVRNGSVIDLQIAPGRVGAVVSGSDLYDVVVKIRTLKSERWASLCQDCAGTIESLVELLQGRFSTGVMERICRQETGLFPAPKEISFTCSCPDGARMCKHVAAVLYGIGARLDERPELLFRLREVDEKDLLATAGADAAPVSKNAVAAEKIVAADQLSELFGIDFDGQLPPTAAEPKVPASVAAQAAGARKKRGGEKGKRRRAGGLRRAKGSRTGRPR